MGEAEQVEATIRQNKPTAPEIRDLDAVRKALNAEFDALVSTDTLISPNRPHLKQTELLLRAHLQKVFGGDDTQWEIGGFSERDLPGRLQKGWMVLTKGHFPNYANGRATWNDTIARKLGVWTNADGTIRWGSRGKIFICFIRRDLWMKNRLAEQAAWEEHYKRTMRRGKRKEEPEPGVTIETEVGITRERVKGKRRAGTKGSNKEN